MAIVEQGVRERVARFWSGPVAWNEPLAKRSTLRIGGPAWALLEPESSLEVQRIIAGCRAAGLPWLVIGAGSNLLVSDQGFPGVVLVLGPKFATIREGGRDGAGRILVNAEAGCRLAKLLHWCQSRGLSGLEFLAGIPGSIGGAVVMNAGAWGGEVRDVLTGLQVLREGAEEAWSGPALAFTYRSWNGPPGAVVLNATFALVPGTPEAIRKRSQAHVRARRGKQPKGVACAGSFFKNPPGDFAGRLIEAAGLKGVTVGGARVSEVHANFLVNAGGATALEMLALAKLVQEKVGERFGVHLEPEVRIVGAADQLREG